MVKFRHITFREFKELVKKHGGWMDGDIARFPSVHAKDQFEKSCAEAKARATRSKA